VSDPEVVVRLLAAIDEKERAAREFAEDLELDPSEVQFSADQLRLCQAHRDIVAMFEQAEREEELGDGGTGLQGQLVVAVATLENVIKTLARGYGIEDGED
jgi:hypothetical protein